MSLGFEIIENFKFIVNSKIILIILNVGALLSFRYFQNSLKLCIFNIVGIF
jgi:hypothetical protein